jgi:site-specific DNA recombinase
MDKLDALVAEHLEERLLDPRRLEEVMIEVLERREDWAERRRQHVGGLRSA